MTGVNKKQIVRTEGVSVPSLTQKRHDVSHLGCRVYVRNERVSPWGRGRYGAGGRGQPPYCDGQPTTGRASNTCRCGHFAVYEIECIASGKNEKPI